MRTTLAAGLAAIAILAACGGSGGGGGQPAGSTKVTMTDFQFDPSTISVAHGNVTFWLVNSGSQSHDMSIRDGSGNTVSTSELISAGDSTAFTVNNLAAGSYTFICTQPGHADLGMKGTLTVT
ncbi:MAG TPA: cupredoxin domain-containing protein [Candidatus Dormibacteraeota bacterium]|nr:cupredoxin domain-containing protein [Candidatus Dormibacteraeota bacterium]